MFRFPRVPVVLTAGLLFVAACGGSSSPKPAAQTGGNDTSSSSSSSSSGSSNSSSSSGGRIVAGDIVVGAYAQGNAHVDISGGKSLSIDFNTASGITQQGNTAVTFTDGSSSTLTLVISQTETDAGVAIQANGFATGGQFGDKCNFDIKKNDASNLEGTFTCSGVDGVDGGTVFTENLEIRGTFSAKS